MKGQMLIIGVIMITMTLIILANLMPTIVEQMDTITTATNDTTAQTLTLLIPAFLVLGIIMTIVYYLPQQGG